MTKQGLIGEEGLGLLGVRIVLIPSILIGAIACAREYENAQSIASPSGEFVIDVVREIRGANDPDLFWQHVSLRRADQASPILPGNLAVYSARSSPGVRWTGPNSAAVEIRRSDGGTSFEAPPSEKTIGEVTVSFSVTGE